MALRNLLLLGLLAGAMAIPLNVRVLEDSVSTCAQQCTSESNNFQYTVGNTYTYTYETDTITKVEGATEEHSSLHIQAKADIEVISKCDFVLNLRDVTLKDSQPDNYQSRREVARNAEFKRELEAQPLRFAFQDGRIEEVCPMADEKTWVLNIKRGLISAFQTDTEIREGVADVTETDVSGICAAEYRVLRRTFNSIVMSKNKDLMSCTDRHGHVSSLQATPYRVDSKYQSAPLLRGFYACEQTIHNDGYLQSTTCTENNVFRPFSKHLNGAMTKVEQRLTYVSKRYGTNNAPAVIFRSDLLFEHRPDSEELSRDSRDAQQKLAELCRISNEDVRPETPRLFSELVMTMSRLDINSLRNIYNGAQRTCPKARSYMDDVLPMIGSTASVALMTQLITTNKVSQVMAEVWLTSVAFTPKPTSGMLAAVKDLVDTPKPSRKSLLAVSTLVHGYCRVAKYCGEERVVQELVQTFTRHLGRNCVTTPRNYDTVLMSLKALGNTGHAESAANVIAGCFSRKTSPIEIRLAAVKALRRTSCEAERTPLIALLRNAEEDPELRIAAYLAVMECPNHDNLDAVKRVLETEQVNQVGSFIWTHLTNLMETSDIHKQDLRHILEDEVLKKEFNLDQRKFSRNYEWSAFSEMLNTGAKVESNLIWSHKSFIPRAAMVNLTVDMFGHSVNLFEVGGRLEGMEFLVESLFGPNSKKSENAQPERRGRDPQATFDDQFADPLSADPSGSMYLKIFGNEIRYMDLKDMPFSQLKEKLNPLDLLIKLSQPHDIEVARNMMFLNSNVIVPTISGLPLKLAVDGVVSVNVKVKGKMDVRNPKRIDINGELAPSAAVEISTAMCVDAGLAKAGMKMTTSLHSSVATNALIQVQDGKVVNLNLKFPKKKMEIFGIKSTFFVEHRDALREQSMIRQDRYEVTKCMSSQFLEKVLGVGVCAELQYANASRVENAPYFPLTGPISIKLDVLNKDAPNGYKFEAKYEEKKVKAQLTNVVYVGFNTPGSKVNRNFVFDLGLVKAKKAINFNMNTPWKTVGLSGSIQNSASLKRVEGSLELDEDKRYSLVAELRVDARAQKTTYTPSLTISMPGSPDISMAGSTMMNKKGSVLANLNLRNVFKEPLTFRGKVDKVGNPKRFKYVITNTELRSQWLNSKISGFVDKGPSITSRIQVEYQLKNSPKHRFAISHKSKKFSTKTLKKYVTNSAVVSSQFPNLNLELKADFVRNQKVSEVNLDFGYGSNYKMKKSRLTLSSSFSNKSKKPSMAYAYKFDLKYPLYKVAVGFVGSHAWDGHQLKTIASANMMPFWQKRPTPKKVDIEVNYAKKKGPLFKVNADVTMKVPGNSFRISQVIDEVTDNKFWREETVVQYNQKEAKAIATYKIGPKHEATLTVELPQRPKTEVKATFVPNLKKFDGALEVKYGTRKYGLEAQYNYLAKASNGKAKVDINGKIYTAEGSYKYNPYNSEVHGKVSVEGRLYSTDLSYNLNHRGQNTNGNGNFKLSTPSTKISTDIGLKRQGTDVKATFDVKHNDNRQSLVFIEAEIKDTNARKPSLRTLVRVKRSFVVLNADYTYNKNYNGPQVEGNLILTNNYLREYPKITIKAKHDSLRTMYKTQLEYDMDSGRKYEADLEVKMASWKDMENTLVITTPIANYQRQIYKQTHKITPREFTGTLSAEARNKKIELAVGAKRLGSRNVEGSIAFKSPFRNFEDMSLIVKHSDDSRTYTSNVKAKWAPRKQIDATFQTKHTRRGYYIDNEGKFEVKTPFYGYETMALTWDHSNAENTFKTQATALWNRNQIKLDLDNTFNRNTIDSKISLTTPFRVSLAGALNINGIRQVKGNLRLTTPYRGYERTELTINHSQRRSTWNSLAKLEFEPGQKVEVSGELTLSGSDVKGNIALKTPWRHVQSVSMAAEKSGELATGISVKANFNHDESRTKARFAYDYVNRRGTTTNMSFNLDSPIRGYERISYVSTSSVSNNKLTGSTTIKYPGQTTTSTYEYFFDSWRNFGGKTEATWGNGQKMALEGKFAHAAITKGELKFTSPFPRFENMGFKFGHEGHWRRFSNSIEAFYGSKMAKLENEFLLDHNMQLRVKFTSPNSKLVEDFGVEFNKGGRWDDFTTNTVLSYRRKKIEAKINSNTNSKVWSAVVKTPFRYFEETSIKVNHEGDLSRFENHAEIQYYRGKIELDTQFTLSGNELRASTIFKSPYRQISEIKAKYTHSGNLRRFNCQAELEYQPRKKIIGELEFKNTRQLEGKIDVSTPFRGYEKMTAAFNHRGDWSDFSNHAEVMYQRGKKIELDAQFSHEDTRVNGRLAAKTPFSSYEEMAVAFDHNGPWSNFKNHGEVQYQRGKKVELDSSFRYRRASLAAALNFKSPFSNYETMDLTVNHDGDYYNFKSGATLKYPYRRQITTGITWKLDTGSEPGLDTTITFSSPYRNFENIVFKAKHDGRLTNFKTASSVEYDGQKIAGEATYKLTGDYYGSATVGTSLKLNSPFRALRQLEAKVDLTSQRNRYTASYDIAHNYKKIIDMDATYSLSGTEHKASVQMRHPRHMNNVMTLDLKETEISSGLLFNWDVDQPDSNVRTNFVFKRPSSSSRYAREVALEVILPSRTVKAKGEIEYSRQKFLQAAELSWGPRSVLGYEVTYNDLSRGILEKYDLDLKVKTPVRTVHTRLDYQDNKRKVESNAMLQWDAVRSPNKKMNIGMEYQKSGQLNEFTVTINHSAMPKALKTKDSWMLTNTRLQHAFALEYGTEELMTYSVNLLDKTVSNNNINYTAAFTFTYPKANLDIGFDTHLAKKGKICSSNSVVRYVSARGQTVTSNIYGTINLFRKEFMVVLRNPVINGKLEAKMETSPAKTDVSLVTTLDRDVYRTNILINKRQQKFDMKMYYNPSSRKDMLHVYARYLNPRAIKAEAYTVANNRKSRIGLLTVNLKKNHLLNSAISWEPATKDKLKNMIKNTINKIEPMMERMRNQWNSEVRSKQTQIRYSLAPVAQSMEELSNSINEDISTIKYNLNSLYNNDEFYVKTIHQYSGDVMNNLQRRLEPVADRLRRNYAEQLRRYRDMSYSMQSQYNRHYTNLQTALRRHADSIANIDYQEYYRNLVAHTQRLKNKVVTHPHYIRLVRLSQQAQDKMAKYSTSDALAPFRDMRNRVRSCLVDRYEEAVEYARDAMEKYLVLARKYDLGRQALEYAAKAKNQLVWTWNYWQVEDTITDFFRELYQDTMTSMKDKSKGFMDYYLQLEKNKVIKFKPAQGEIEFQVYVPARIQGLDKLPKFPIEKYISKLMALTKRVTPVRQWAVWDTYYKYKPTTDYKNWIPPFKAHATIAGRQHFMTFDRQFYEFAGDCSYVLARDFIDGNFTVLVNYEGLNKKSLSVATGNKMIEIFPDYRVTVDGRSVELPLHFSNTTIVREGHKVIVSSDLGVNIDCDMVYDVCQVQTTGWYFGKVGGLMGTYDNEPSNDLMTSRRSVSRNVDEFVGSWAKDRSCRNRNTARQVAPDVNSPAYAMCARYFKEDSSPFRPCFGQLEPEPFMKMCLNHAREAADSELCTISAFYTKECTEHGVKLPMPSHCVRCEGVDGETFEGSNYEISGENQPKSADTVLVVEEKACNEQVATKFNDVVRDMERALVAKGLRNNHFGLVAFGGEGMMTNEQSHTLDGQIMNTYDRLAAAFSALRFTGEGHNDALRAVRFAALYPFRTGVAKNIVLIKCSTCHEDTVRYTELQQLLLERGITLHVLMEHQFTARTQTPKTSYIFGADSYAAYTHKDATQANIGDREMVRQLSMPKDICVAVAQQTNGSVFNSLKLVDSRVRYERYFTQVFGKRLAETATPSCQRCECIADKTGHGVSICKPCEMPSPFMVLGPVNLDSDMEAAVEHMGDLGEEFETYFR